MFLTIKDENGNRHLVNSAFLMEATVYGYGRYEIVLNSGETPTPRYFFVRKEEFERVLTILSNS